MKTRKLIALAVLAVILIMSCAFAIDGNHGDRVALFNNLTIPEGETITGDAVAIFGQIEIKGTVRGDAVAVFGNLDIYGAIGGDIVAVFGNADIYDKATVGGDVVGVLGNVDRAAGAKVDGDIVDTKSGVKHNGFDLTPNIGFFTIIGIAMMYGLSCLVTAIIPERIDFMVRQSHFNIGRHLGIGILVMLVLILLIPILIITIIGIIPAILLIFAFMLAGLISTTAIYIALGQRIAAAVEGKNAVYIQLLIGLVVVNALQMVPVVGFLASLAVFFVGLGVAFDTRLGKPLASKKAL